MWPIVRFGLNFFASLAIIAGIGIIGLLVIGGLVGALT